MWRGMFAVVSAIALVGCATSNVSTQGFTRLESGRVLLMPPDIKYYRVTASGITEPHAEWTGQARTAFDDAFQDFAAGAGIDYKSTDRDEISDTLADYDRLHSAVGATIIMSHYGATKLPSKKNAESGSYRFDWSLGPGVASLADVTDAKYALFVYFRDYQAGGGRVGVAVFAALFGASVYTGHQSGFASLVDLQSGDVVWFNNLPLAQGDMRSAEGAGRLVEQLFAEFAPDNT